MRRSASFWVPTVVLSWALVLQITNPLRAESPAKLVARWPLQDDARDVVGNAHGSARNLSFAKGSAYFNGRDSLIQVNHSQSLHAADRDFSISLWVRCQTPLTSTLGDLVNKFDPEKRRGFNLHLAGSSPAYNAMSDSRHVHFGIDDAFVGPWVDHGKPWPSNSLITNLVTFEGNLYCGIADADKAEHRARVFKMGANQEWIDCGRLGNDANHHSVMSMIVHQGKLYAGTGIWDWVQALGGLKGAPSAAPTRVFVYEGGQRWRDLGQVGNGSRVLCLASFQGELYAGIDSVGKGHAYKYDGKSWIDCGSPDGKNFECLLPYAGKLYAATHGNVYSYEGGQSWNRIGTAPHDINQIHSMQVAQGKILLGTWPQGYVLRYDSPERWTKIGRLGLPEGQNLCNEVMNMVVYNGKLYAGLIPKAEVYRHDRDGDWKLLGSLAKRADWNEKETATWVRITCLNSYQGRLFAGTGSCQGRSLDASADASLGRVFSFQAGQVLSHEHDIGGNWTHLAAVRRGRDLELYVNGKLSISRTLPKEVPFHLSNEAPLQIGFGAQNYFHGAMKDLRWYEGSLDPQRVQDLARPE